MRQPIVLLFTVCLLFASVVGCIGCTVSEPTAPATPSAPTKPVAPSPAPVKPAPTVRVKLLLFTMEDCIWCVKLEKQLHDPALADTLIHFDLEIVRSPDKRCRQYRVASFPTLIAITATGPVRYPTGGTLGQLAAWLGECQPKMEMKPGGPVGPDGLEVVTDLPVELRKHNISSRGQGCCVFASARHIGEWQNIPALLDFPEWVKSKGLPGGGYPGNLAERVKMISKERGLPEPVLIQYEGKNPAIIELMLKTGRMPETTYNGHDRHLGGHYAGPIAHMVNTAFLGKDYAAILDNNYPKEFLWMTRQEYLDRWCGHGNGWAAGFLNPRPPAPPRSAK